MLISRADPSSVLRLPSAMGVAAILAVGGSLGRRDSKRRSGAIGGSTLCRADTDQRGPISSREAEALRSAIRRSARHYELTVIVSPFEQANDVRVAPAVLVCAHIAHSLVSTLRRRWRALRDNGAQIIGIVLWAAEAPSLDPPWIFESWFASDRAVPATRRSLRRTARRMWSDTLLAAERSHLIRVCSGR